MGRTTSANSNDVGGTGSPTSNGNTDDASRVGAFSVSASESRNSINSSSSSLRTSSRHSLGEHKEKRGIRNSIAFAASPPSTPRNIDHATDNDVSERSTANSVASSVARVGAFHSTEPPRVLGEAKTKREMRSSLLQSPVHQGNQEEDTDSVSAMSLATGVGSTNTAGSRRSSSMASSSNRRRSTMGLRRGSVHNLDPYRTKMEMAQLETTSLSDSNHEQVTDIVDVDELPLGRLSSSPAASRRRSTMGLRRVSQTSVRNLDQYRHKLEMSQLETTTLSETNEQITHVIDVDEPTEQTLWTQTEEEALEEEEGVGEEEDSPRMTNEIDVDEEMAAPSLPRPHNSRRNDQRRIVMDNDPSSQLMEAMPVMDDPSGELPVAEHYDEARKFAASQKRKQQDFGKAAGLLLFGAVALGGIILLVVLLSDNNDGETDDLNRTIVPTASPTPEPTTLVDVLKSLLPQDTVRVIENDPAGTTPQAKAFEWLFDDMSARFEIYPDRKIFQRFALATLFFATRGETDWYQNATGGWLTIEDECFWSFNKAHLEMFEDIDDEAFIMKENPCVWPNSTSSNNSEVATGGEYQYLWLPESGLTLEGSELPPEIYLLTSLRMLGMWGNDLRGSISSHIGQLTNLEVLGLGTSDMTGTIPSEIGLCTNLKALVLPTNELSGTLPSSVGRLTKLEHLWLYENELSGHLATELGLLNKLRTLELLLNDFGGTIPSEIGNLGKLEVLNIHTLPLLHGVLPTEMGRLTSLEKLYTSETGISGNIPSEMGLMENLDWWSGQQSALNGTIPFELGQLSFLEVLSLRDNFLSGPLPEELVSLESLFILFLQNNQLNSSIPDIGGNLSSPLNYGRFSLFGNELTGSIPASTMARMPYLDELWLHGNKLSGQIPSEIGAMEFIFDLQLQDNNLSGSLPTELSLLNASAFWVFNISNNPLLTGEIPEELCVLEEDEILAFDCLNDQSQGLCGCSSCACDIDADGFNELDTMGSSSANAANGTDA